MDVCYEVIMFNSYLHYLVFISMFEFDPHPSLSPPPPTLLFFLYNFPKSNLGVKDIICPIGDWNLSSLVSPLYYPTSCWALFQFVFLCKSFKFWSLLPLVFVPFLISILQICIDSFWVEFVFTSGCIHSFNLGLREIGFTQLLTNLLFFFFLVIYILYYYI